MDKNQPKGALAPGQLWNTSCATRGGNFGGVRGVVTPPEIENDSSRGGQGGPMYKRFISLQSDSCTYSVALAWNLQI